MTSLRRAAEAHIRSYQARIDIEGWSDDLCIEICEAFAKAQRVEEVSIVEARAKNAVDAEEFFYWLSHRKKEWE